MPYSVSLTKGHRSNQQKPVSVLYVKTFMSVPVGDSLLYVDSRGRVRIANNEGDYSRKFNIELPGTIFIPKKALR
jgi:S-adenosylmethionine hydrolase